MFRFLDTILDRFSAVLGALLFSQLPQFFFQYQMRLGGHVEELEQQVKMIRLTAEANGKSLSEYIQKFLQSQDIDFITQGHLLENMVNRLRALQNAIQTLQESSVVSKPIEFFVHFQKDIAAATFKEFIPGFNFTTEEIFYIFIGVVFGICLYRGIKALALSCVYLTQRLYHHSLVKIKGGLSA